MFDVSEQVDVYFETEELTAWEGGSTLLIIKARVVFLEEKVV